MTNETEEDINEEESSSKPSSFLTSLLNHSKSVSELNNVIPPSALDGVSIKLDNLDVVETKCKFFSFLLKEKLKIIVFPKKIAIAVCDGFHTTVWHHF